MIRFATAVLLLFTAGCSSFFQDRVEESDKIIRKLEQDKRALAMEARRLEESLSSSDANAEDTTLLMARLNDTGRSLADAEEALRVERETRDEALEGAKDEMKWQKELLALILGIGATAVSALVGGAKKSVGV